MLPSTSPAPLCSPELPRWINDRDVDSEAMLNAFLEYKAGRDGEAKRQLEAYWCIEHYKAPIRLFGEEVEPTKVRPENMPHRLCADPWCKRCLNGQGGFQFRWIHFRWAAAYDRRRRRGSRSAEWLLKAAHRLPRRSPSQ